MREGSISVLRKARSLFPSAPPSSSKAHSPKKRAPKWKFSLILPPFSSLAPPSRRSGLNQKPSASLWASVISSVSLLWIKVVLHPHRCQANFPTLRATNRCTGLCDSQKAAKTDRQTHNTCRRAYTLLMCVTAAYQSPYASPLTPNLSLQRHTLTCTYMHSVYLSQTHFMQFFFF